jgi:hypothetical protein
MRMNKPLRNTEYSNSELISAEPEIDPRLIFLTRAAVRFDLVQAGEMTVDEAFDGLVISLQCACACDRDRVERWERLDGARRRCKGRAA